MSAAAIVAFAFGWQLLGPHLPRLGSKSVTTDNLRHLRVGQLQAVSVARSCNEEGTVVDQSDWPVLVQCLNDVQPAPSGRQRGAARPLLYFLQLRIATGTVRIYLETPWAMDRKRVVAAVSGPLGPVDYYEGEKLAVWSGAALRASGQLGGSQKP